MAASPGGDAGIRVNREVLVSRSEGSNEVHIESALPQRPQVRRLSDSSSILSDIFRHPDVREDAIRRKIKQVNDRDRHSPKDLVDFFRNTTPPPHNYMSIPDRYDSTSEEDRGKWQSSTLRIFRKKKQQKPKKVHHSRPKSITLPDTAVAGTTIGGHRHIAISIPIEHAHLDYDNAGGDKGPSVYRPTGVPVGWSPPPAEQFMELFVETRTGPLRANMDPRVVTVLKPVVEARESIETLLQTDPAPQDPPAKDNDAALVLPDSPAKTLDEILATTPTPSLGGLGATRAEHNLRPKTAEPSVGRITAIPSPRLSTFHHDTRNSPSNPASPVNVYCPQRRSSLGNSPRDNRRSLEAPPIRRHRRELSSESNVVRSNRLSIAESILTDGTEPIIGDATTAQGYEVSANRFSVLTNAETVIYAPVTASPKKPGASVGRMPMQPTRRYHGHEDGEVFRVHTRAVSDQGNATRRLDAVDTQRSSSLPGRSALKRSKPGVSVYQTGQDSPFRTSSPRSRAETLVNSVNQPFAGDSFSVVPYMVVAEVKPSSLPASPLPDSPPPSRGARLRQIQTSGSTSSAATTVIKIGSPRRSLSPLSPLSPPTPASAGPTPPESPQHMENEYHSSRHPPQQSEPRGRSTVSLDRISLNRRREWAANRERERAEVEVQRVRAEARAQAALHDARNPQAQAAEPRLQYSLRTDSHRELAKRYEALRDTRERDLEARLALLEQNRDAWLSTMVPLFEKLNNRLLKIYDEDDALRRNRLGQESWEELRIQELAQQYRAQQEHNRQKSTQRRMAYETPGGHKDESQRERGWHHRYSRSEGYNRHQSARDPRVDQRASVPHPNSRRFQHVPTKTPLQAEFEAEIARRQRLEDFDAAVDARIAELSRQSRRGSAAAPGPGHRSRQPSHAASVDLDGFMPDGDVPVRLPNGLDALEPVMRDLMGRSRLRMEDEARPEEAGQGEDLAEYLFEEF